MSDISAPALAAKRQKHRSPSYPAFDLEVAVRRAKTLWDVADRHPINVGSAIESWGYSPKSSSGKLLIATLKKFGLLKDEGSRDARKVELTDLGRRLVVLERESPAWELAAREAVFLPAIHHDIWSRYDCALPSDQVVSPSLVLDRGFSVQAAADLLAEFRASLDYAGVSQTDDGRGEVSNPDSDHGIQEQEETEWTQPPRTTSGDYGVDLIARRDDGWQTAVQTKHHSQDAPVRRERAYGGGMQEGHRSVSIPFSPGEWAVLQAPFPISEAEFEALLSMLNAMKPGLVVSRQDFPSGSHARQAALGPLNPNGVVRYDGDGD